VRHDNNKHHLAARIAHGALLSACLFGAGLVRAGGVQIDEPWQTTGSNTGNVDGAALTATSAGDSWLATLNNNDTTLYQRADLFGSNAIPGTIGDFFGLGFRPGDTDTFTITLNAPLTDPIIFIGDLDVVGSSVTVPTGAVNLTSNADGEWNGLTLTALRGAPDATGAFGAVLYPGTYAAGSEFVFNIDFSPTDFSFDTIGLGIAVVPVPAAVWLFGSALGLLGWVRRRRSRLARSY
jgi:hypothetical protein